MNLTRPQIRCSSTTGEPTSVMGKGFRHTRSIEVSSGNGRSCPSFRTSARHGRGAQPLAEIDIDQVAGHGITGFGSAVGRKPADRRPYRDPWKQLLAVPRAGPSSPLTGRNPEGHRSSTQWCVTFGRGSSQLRRALIGRFVADRSPSSSTEGGKAGVVGPSRRGRSRRRGLSAVGERNRILPSVVRS